MKVMNTKQINQIDRISPCVLLHKQKIEFESNLTTILFYGYTIRNIN